MREKVGPVLATGLQSDPRHAPSALQAGGRQDGLSAGGAPPGAVRPGPAHSSTITAVLCREGLLPYGESVVAAKRCVHLFGAVLTCLGSCVGSCWPTISPLWTPTAPCPL